jgi:hypothetical protein
VAELARRRCSSAITLAAGRSIGAGRANSMIAHVLRKQRQQSGNHAVGQGRPDVARRLAGCRLDKVVDAQIRVADSLPVRRPIGLLPVAALVDVLPGLAAMLDDLVGDANRVAQDYPGIITFAHSRSE